MKRFFVAVKSGSAGQEKRFVEALELKKIAYWHWISNVWLISVPTESYADLGELRAMINEAFPDNTNYIILDVDAPYAWLQRSPEPESKERSDWLQAYWYEGKGEVKIIN